MKGKFYAALDYEQLEARIAELEAENTKLHEFSDGLAKDAKRFDDENERLLARIAEIEGALEDIAEFTYCKPGFRGAWRDEVRRKARKALEKGNG